MSDPHSVVTHSKRGAKFADVLENLRLAIEGQGLVIDHESFVGRMLERTGKDVGSARKLYADARAFVFCSAALSRKTMEADPTKAYNQDDATGFIRLNALRLKVAAQVSQKLQGRSAKFKTRSKMQGPGG